ncbi:MAG: CHASE4 domain-containing protein [Candidatus Latescibacterota bacterium]
MTLRKETYLIMGIAVFLMIVSLTVAARLIVLESFTGLERAGARQHVGRALGYLNMNYSRLQSDIEDWAFWDDTYRFAGNATEEYIDSNLMDDTFVNLDINYFLITDIDSRIVYQKSIDLRAKKEIPFPEEIERLLPSPALKLPNTANKNSICGILMVDGAPVLFAAAPILTSRLGGPSRGMLIMGKNLDRNWMSDISRVLGLIVNLYPLNGKTSPKWIQPDDPAFRAQSGVRVISRGQNTISGYTVLRDFENRPAFILNVDVPRDMYQRAKISFYYYLFSLAGVMLLFGLLTIALLERRVLSRIMHLGNDICTIGASGNRSARLEVRGNNELSQLAEEINRMLENLRNSENSLRDSEDRFMMLFENIPVMVVAIDRKGEGLLCNREYSRILGWTPEELKTASDPLTPAIENQTERLETKRILLRADGIFREFTIRVKSGILRRQMWANFLLPSNTLMFIGYDITERREMEEQLQVRQRMDSLGTLAGGIAHDFNNILTIIKGNLGLLQMDTANLSSEQREKLNETEVACNRATDIIHQFQVLSNGDISQKAVVDMYAVVEEVFNFLSISTDRLIEKKIDFGPGEYTVRGNASELHQVFLNLGTNSAQAIKRKGSIAGDAIRVSACVEEVPGTGSGGLIPGEYVHIRFEDTGGGMPESVRKRIFEPFFSTKEKGPRKSQGLGLTMVYMIVTSHHHGAIDVESTEGGGSMFHIFLPRAFPEKIVPQNSPGTKVGGNETILVVDDEDMIRVLAEKVLREKGYTVLLAHDGETGVTVFANSPNDIDLVILDLIMPRMTGYAVFEEIRRMRPDVPVILSSGYSEQEIDEHLFSRTNGLLPKPYNIQEFLKKVRDVLDHGNRNRGDAENLVSSTPMP